MDAARTLRNWKSSSPWSIVGFQPQWWENTTYGAVEASEPEPSRHYKMVDGSIIPHLGHKQIRALTDELAASGQYKAFNFKCSVADVDKPLLSVAQIVHNGGKVVFSKDESYIEMGAGRRDQLEFRNGLYVLKLWVPRDQKMDFHGQA